MEAIFEVELTNYLFTVATPHLYSYYRYTIAFIVLICPTLSRSGSCEAMH